MTIPLLAPPGAGDRARDHASMYDKSRLAVRVVKTRHRILAIRAYRSGVITLIQVISRPLRLNRIKGGKPDTSNMSASQ
jgi:hypothetical protein